MTPEELRYNALVVTQANLQRLVVMENAVSAIAHRPVDEAAVAALHTQLDAVSGAFERADRVAAVDPADLASIREFAAPLLAAVTAYYETDLSGPPASQAAFGAAHVYASMYLNRGTIRMGEVFGHEEWADRARQHLPMFNTLQAQAQTAVGSSATGTPSEEAVQFIAHHVRVALDDRATALQQVAGIEPMLDGQYPRQP